MTRVFITGGAGSLGSVLVKTLLSKGEKVTVYDNFATGKRKYLPKDSNLRIINGDIQNLKKLSKFMKNHSIVFHFAANSDIRNSTINLKTDFEVNLKGTLNVLNGTVKNKIKNFVFASTSTVYGFPKRMPTPESYGPCLPESFYASSKLACEGYISAYTNLFNIKSWIFRFANVVGSPSTHGIIFDFMKKIKRKSNYFEVLGDGNQEKSYITNQMLVEAILTVISKTQKNRKRTLLYNIGNSDSIKVKNIVKLIMKQNNSNKKILYAGGKRGWKGDIYKMNLDINEIIKTGWTPSKNSRECIIESIENFWT